MIILILLMQKNFLKQTILGKTAEMAKRFDFCKSDLLRAIQDPLAMLPH
jgi:hypothetical protein